jgi:hypothetical protein
MTTVRRFAFRGFEPRTARAFAPLEDRRLSGCQHQSFFNELSSALLLGSAGRLTYKN